MHNLQVEVFLKQKYKKLRVFLVCLKPNQFNFFEGTKDKLVDIFHIHSSHFLFILILVFIIFVRKKVRLITSKKSETLKIFNKQNF